MVLFFLLSMGFSNSLNANSSVPNPHSRFSIFHKKKNEGVINDRGHGRGHPPKVRSGYKINKKK